MQANKKDMKRNIIILVALLIALNASAQLKLDFGDDSALRKLNMAEMAIKELYVDTINEQNLVEDAVRGMLDQLDPHSSYTTAAETKAMTEPLEGSFEGIGVQFNMVEDTLMVIQPVLNGPSEKVGIRAGDRIVSVNDTAIAGVKMERNAIMRRLRGHKNTKVVLTIVRRGVADKLKFTVTRDKIPVKTIDAVYMIRPQIGYIRIGSFGATTYDEFMEGVQTLKKKGMKNLILDLQDNGGGYLQAAAMIANEFLKKGDLIVYTEGRKAPRQEFKAQGDGKLLDGKVVVLINEFSASAAEIVTGAIQDQDRGTIVGRRSFGKGLVQRPIEFNDGSMLRLTVAHYYTPSGRCIQKPYKKGEKLDYEMDLDNRFKHGELYSADSIHFSDSLKYYTQRLHRVVYGGGGIMPDTFVPLDTTIITKYYRDLSNKSIIINMMLKYEDDNRKNLKSQYKNFEEFDKTYAIPQSLIDAIVKEGDKENIKPKDDAELKQSLLFMNTQLKALVARDLWDMSEYFQVMNNTSDIVKKGIEVTQQQLY